LASKKKCQSGIDRVPIDEGNRMTKQMHTGRAVRRILITTGLVGSMMLVAACGGSSDSGEAAGESAPAAAEEAAPAETAASEEEAPAELIPIKYVQPWVIQGESAGQFAAVREGFFAEEGLDVEIIPGGPDVRAGALLASGSADFAVMNPAGVYTNRQEDIPVVGVGGINQADGLFIMCKTSTGIDGFEDLAGKKVGIWVGGGEAGIQAATVKAGLAVEDVEWLPQKFSMEEFFNDAFDCASATEWNEKHVVYKEGYTAGTDVNELRPTDVGLFLPGDSIVTLESTVAERPEVVQGLVTGTLRGWQWVCSSEENRKAGAQYTVDAAPDLDLDLQIIQVNEMCSLMSQGPAAEAGMIGDMVQSSWQQSADAALAIGQLEQPADVATAFSDQFVAAVPADYRKITWQ
jgi:NitT/TauT family transport system substrate-binding protein